MMSNTCADTPRLLVLEGNIGAGKSTFLKIIQDSLPVQCVFEPHEQWQGKGEGENLLDKFYQDTKRWAYTFQSYAFITRVLAQQKQAKENPHGVQVLERSVYSDRYCFAKNCFEAGTMSKLEWKLYCEWFGWLVEQYTQPPAGFIYLRTTPQVCYERMQQRNRKEEIGVSLDYLRTLHDKHEEWLIHKKNIASRLQEVPVLALDCTVDFVRNHTRQQEHVARIVEFFGLTERPAPLFGQQSSATL